jgi:hypothetical protein
MRGIPNQRMTEILAWREFVAGFTQARRDKPVV